MQKPKKKVSVSLGSRSIDCWNINQNIDQNLLSNIHANSAYNFILSPKLRTESSIDIEQFC